MCIEVNPICDCRNACYILDQMVEMGFSMDGGIAMLQSAFKEAFVVSVMYGTCLDHDSCLSLGFLYTEFGNCPVTDIIQSVGFIWSPTEPLQGEPAAGRSGVLCKLGVLRGDLYPSPVPHREAFLPPAVWLAVLSYPWHRDKDRGEYSTMAMSKVRDGEWSKAEFGSGIKGNLDNISFPRSNFCMDTVLYTFVINFCKSSNVSLIKSTIEFYSEELC